MAALAKPSRSLRKWYISLIAKATSRGADASASRSVARRSSGLTTSGQRSSPSCAWVGPSGRRWSPRWPWLGTVRIRVQNDVGSAQVAEEFAVLGARYRFLLGRHLRPTLSLAAGRFTPAPRASRFTALPGRDAALWSFLLDGGVGVGLVLAERFEVAFATHAQIADPYPAIRFDRSVVATSTRPSLLFTLTIGAWL